MSETGGAKSVDSVRKQIRSYLASKTTSEIVERTNDNESLLEAGIIDSVGMVDLIAHIEKTYGISISEDEMIPENFDSYQAIAAYIVGKKPT